jgi:hypothetical protein
MGKLIWFLLILLIRVPFCYAQQITQELKYQLVESILKELTPPFTYAKRGLDGKYYRPSLTIDDTVAVRLLLLDHPYSTDDDYHTVLASEGSPELANVMQYFSLADVTYMRQQLPASKLFNVEQAKIQEPWVRVIALDTLTAMNKRLGWQVDFLSADSLRQRYGSDKVFVIWDILFSKDHKRALVNVSDDGWKTCVYSKVKTVWRREAILYAVEH